MRIIRTIPSFYPHVTGPANQAYEISKRMNEFGHESPVWTSPVGAADQPLFETIENIPVHRFPMIAQFMSFNILPCAPAYLYSDSFDIVHSHSYRGFLSESAYRICKLRNKPFILHNHGTFIGYKSIVDKSRWLPYIVYDQITRKKAAFDADAIVVSTAEEKKEAIDFGINSEKVRIIPMGIDTDMYNPTPQSPTDEFTILFVGRLSRNRNVEQTIKAVSRLSGDFELRIVGDEAKSSQSSASGYIEELKQMIKKEGIEDQVTFTGAKYKEDLKEEYSSADVFVYTSLYENLGQTILEAAAAGLPIVSTPVGIAPDIVSDGDTGYLVPIGDSRATAQSLINMRNGNTREMGKQIRELVETQYDWDIISNEYIKLYKDVLDG